MFSYVWPIALVVLSNVLYQICSKTMAQGADPFASLIVTYLVSALICVVLYYALNREANLIREFGKMGWAPFVFGVVLLGLEVGFLYAYKAGWQVSTASLVQSAALAIALLLVGHYLYREELSWNKLIGAAACLVGLVFINLK